MNYKDLWTSHSHRINADDSEKYMDEEDFKIAILEWESAKTVSRVELPVGVPKPKQLNEQTLWQTCPKCNGQGWMSKPSWVAGDTNEWTSTSAMHVCDICWGAKIIQTPKSL